MTKSYYPTIRMEPADDLESSWVPRSEYEELLKAYEELLKQHTELEIKIKEMNQNDRSTQ